MSDPEQLPPEPELEADARRRRSLFTALGLRLWTEDGMTHGRAELGPGVWGTGTRRPRLGALATMADIVAGLQPTGMLTPTVDLNVQLVSPAPSRGTLRLACHPLKVGRRLFVGEVVIHHHQALVARALVTFLNQHFGAGERPPAPDPDEPAPIPFDSWLSPQFPDERTVLVERDPAITNGPGGTIQGGLQATLAELASEWVLKPKGSFQVVDLDIRYLNPVTVGPLVATAEVAAGDDDWAFVRVRLNDAGANLRSVAYVTTVCRRLGGD